ncbi:MAG: FAD-dependent thymidylate synthase [Bacteroidales bacterium]|nr:FAD-dependent thymidylate synthase [Bacteroidales bacterium]
MRKIEPSFELISPIDRQAILTNLELAGRNCYKSEGKITPESAGKFIKMLIQHGTESVLEHEKITVRFICDRGVSHELVRHRIASYSQESTRYCNYGHDGQLTFIVPEWYNHSTPETQKIWDDAMLIAEKSYLDLLKLGWTPQQARAVLPNSLKTDIIMTANIREWRTIFRLRCATKAHPQMRQLMIPFANYLKEQLPELFEDINY